jgi:DNA (cytosine-5)-methyltransferase 1
MRTLRQSLIGSNERSTRDPKLSLAVHNIADAMKQPRGGIATIDLFAGAGGLSLGARAAGADVRLSVDNDPWSCRTLRQNSDVQGGSVLDADVRDLEGGFLRDCAGVRDGEPLLIVGGPPCQPFSKAAYWTDDGKEAKFRRDRARGMARKRPTPPSFVRPDRRRTLVQEFLRLVIEAEADAFIFENVRSIGHPRHRPILDGLVEAAASVGYRTALGNVNAAAYGVPQRRHRVFLIASRHHAPAIPAPTHQDPKKADQGLPAFRPVGPALDAFAGESYAEPEEVVTGRWAEHLRAVPPGGNYKVHTAWAGHPNPTWETETRFWNFLLKLHPDLPSWTINANPGPWVGPFHWDTRRLRTAELAAIQGFPARYDFAGSRRERVRQIGNAVPVGLASAMIGSLVTELGLTASQRTPLAA